MFAQESVMEIQKQKSLYLAKLLEQEVIKQDEFEDLVFKPEINAFHSDYLSSRFIDNINFGWSAWRAAKAQAVPKWISVKDNLPPANILVLGMSQTRSNIFNIYNVMALDEFEEVDVTHWMPLPDAPQEPTND